MIKWILIILLHSQISGDALLSHHQCFLLQEMGINTETHSQTQSKRQTLEHSALKGMSSLNPSPHSSGIPLEEAEIYCKSQWEWKKQGPVNQHEQSSHKLVETEAAYSGPHQVLYSFQFGVFIGFLGMQMSGSLIFMPSLGLFSFCWLAVSNFNVTIFVLSYYILNIKLRWILSFQIYGKFIVFPRKYSS